MIAPLLIKKAVVVGAKCGLVTVESWYSCLKLGPLHSPLSAYCCFPCSCSTALSAARCVCSSSGLVFTPVSQFHVQPLECFSQHRGEGHAGAGPLWGTGILERIGLLVMVTACSGLKWFQQSCLFPVVAVLQACI